MTGGFCMVEEFVLKSNSCSPKIRSFLSSRPYFHLLNDMTNPKDPKTHMTEEDRLRRDEALMNSLKIFHKPENTSDTWPLHLTNTLQSIDTLGHFRYLSYDDEAPAPHSTSTWRREIKSRAKQISPCTPIPTTQK